MYYPEVYIPNRYKQGIYILKDIPFSEVRQNSDDLQIALNDVNNNVHTNEYGLEFFFWFGNDDKKDLSQILRVTYNEDSLLKLVEVFNDGNFHDFIYRNLPDEEVKNLYEITKQKMFNDILKHLQEHFSNDTISRVFAFPYLDIGNEHISLMIANKKSSIRDDYEYGEINLDDWDCYKQLDEIHTIYVNRSFTIYLKSLDNTKDLAIDFYYEFFSELEKAIIKNFNVTEDFKLIIEEVD